MCAKAIDGAKLEYFEQNSSKEALIAYLNGAAANWWTRTQPDSGATTVWYQDTAGSGGWAAQTESKGIRPAFIVKSDTKVIKNADGSYSIATTYVITYLPGMNGTGTAQSVTKNQGEPLTLSGAIFGRDGYTQVGWATTDGGEKAYDLGGTYTTDAAATFYPVWQKNAPQPPTPDPTPGYVYAGEHAERVRDYLAQLRTPFTKLCRIRFLQPDGSTAFALDNNPLGRRNGTFIQEGSITCNLQNGQRRTASITLSNVDAEYDYNVNNIWFGQQVAIDEGLILSDGSEYYIQQGVFYIQEPQETMNPNLRTMTYPLVDKWAYIDGSLFGRLEATYEVPVGTNIFEPVAALLKLDKGNGYPIDHVTPVFTNYYNGKTQALPDGTTAALTDSPYTLRVDSDDGTIGCCTRHGGDGKRMGRVRPNGNIQNGTVAG